MFFLDVHKGTVEVLSHSYLRISCLWTPMSVQWAVVFLSRFIKQIKDSCWCLKIRSNMMFILCKRSPRKWFRCRTSRLNNCKFFLGRGHILKNKQHTCRKFRIAKQLQVEQKPKSGKEKLFDLRFSLVKIPSNKQKKSGKKCWESFCRPGKLVI